MTTSGTTAFTLNLADAIEEAYERAGRRMAGGYDYRTARRSIDIMMVDWANRGLNLWLVEERSFSVVAGTATQTLGTDVIDAIEVVYRSGTGTSQVDMTMNRISVSDWSAIPNKLTTGQPLQFYINRLQAAPVLHMWPVPSASGTIVYWCLRRVQDSGAPATKTMDMPFRFLEAFVSGLAYYLAVKNPELFARVPMLKQMYDEAFTLASGEDRERASVHLTPFSSDITYN